MTSQSAISPTNRASENAKDRGSPPLTLVEGDAPATTEAAQSYGSAARTGHWWMWLVVACVAVAAWYYRFALSSLLTPARTNASATAMKSSQRTIPVVTAVARLRDLDLYLNGLGTVTAFNTVTIRSRVEGELINVAFTEGQTVRERDLLAEIDPRPFEVQRDQAEGQLAKDEAAVKAGRLTLARYKELLPLKSVTAQEVDEQSALVQEAEG